MLASHPASTSPAPNNASSARRRPSAENPAPAERQPMEAEPSAEKNIDFTQAAALIARMHAELDQIMPARRPAPRTSTDLGDDGASGDFSWQGFVEAAGGPGADASARRPPPGSKRAKTSGSPAGRVWLLMLAIGGAVVLAGLARLATSATDLPAFQTVVRSQVL